MIEFQNRVNTLMFLKKVFEFCIANSEDHIKRENTTCWSPNFATEAELNPLV
jgi:hypothetical protein